MSKQTIEIPIKWVKSLLEHAKKADKEAKENKNYDPEIWQLIGYCESLEYIIKE